MALVNNQAHSSPKILPTICWWRGTKLRILQNKPLTNHTKITILSIISLGKGCCRKVIFEDNISKEDEADKVYEDKYKKIPSHLGRGDRKR
jgi:hypothetical protein